MYIYTYIYDIYIYIAYIYILYTYMIYIIMYICMSPMKKSWWNDLYVAQWSGRMRPPRRMPLICWRPPWRARSSRCPITLWLFNRKLWKITIFNGKIHDFYGKSTINYGKSPFLLGKLTISMAIFNSYVKLPDGNKWWSFDDQTWAVTLW